MAGFASRVRFRRSPPAPDAGACGRISAHAGAKLPEVQRFPNSQDGGGRSREPASRTNQTFAPGIPPMSMCENVHSISFQFTGSSASEP